MAQTPSQSAVVRVHATAQTGPTRVALSWPQASASSYTLYRMVKGGSSWGNAIGTAGGSATGFDDPNVVVGQSYEYKVVRTTNGSQSVGYAAAGVQVPAVLTRGKLILVVDERFTNSLASELTQLQDDLLADGWTVVRTNVSPNASPSSVRGTIQGIYYNDPTNVKAVYLFGNVPIPYSGNLSPDGHGDHHGAWPADGYYGAMGGNWTDNSVYNTGSQLHHNYNIPGDGKFDQNDFPSQVELQVGRVDLSGMETFQYQGVSETQLLRNYLNKAHAFKTKAFVPQARACVFDNLILNGMPLAASGQQLAALVGNDQLTNLSNNGSTFYNQVNNQSYLWTYASGGGTWISADRVGSTNDLANSNITFRGVFNMVFGSYFGDWAVQNNFMRAALCNGEALTNVWSGVPIWYFHHMGQGENIGYSVRASMNNTSLYTPQNGGWQGQPYHRIHMGLMGDPSLRQTMVSAPSALNVSQASGTGTVHLSWNASPESGVGGYHVYRIQSDGTPVPLQTAAVQGTSFTTSEPYQTGARYMVRAAKLQSGPGGSYWNLSLGVTATATEPQAPVQQGRLAVRVLLGGAYDPGSNSMRDALRQVATFPMSEPYSNLAFPYGPTAPWVGEGLNQSLLGVTGNDAVVDWVLVELRNPSNSTIVVEARAGLLQRDGDVVAPDGSPYMTFQNTGNYNIAVRHRNHLPCMSLYTYNVPTSGVTTVDMTTGSFTAWGNGARLQMGSRQALMPGDVDHDGQVKYTGATNDREHVLRALGENGITTTSGQGYFAEDLNLDGVVKYTGQSNDRDPILSAIGGGLPTAYKNQQLP